MQKNICNYGIPKLSNCLYNNNKGQPVTVNTGGGLTMKKKAQCKINKISSNSQFTLNHINSSLSFYTGDPNSNFKSDSSCKVMDNTVKTSVKSYRGYLQTRIRNSNIIARNKGSQDSSALCYKKLNSPEFNENIKKHLNKHFGNKAASKKTALLKNKCNDGTTNLNSNSSNSSNSENSENNIDICSSRYNKVLEQYANKFDNPCNCDYNKIINRNLTSSMRTSIIASKYNITKDKSVLNGFTPGYDIYYNDSSLFKKKHSKFTHDPPDAVNHLSCPQ